MDVHNKRTRSFNMSRIRSKDTKPEVLVRKYLHGKGFRYKLYDKALPGKPDLVLPKYKTIIFIHGCFWHGHKGCKYYVIPKTNRRWWTEKIKHTKQLDEKNVKELKRLGWKVIIIFECGLRPRDREKTLNKLAAII